MKDKLRASIQSWLERIDALSVRERLSIFLAAAGGLVAILVFGIILPSSNETKRLREDTAQLQRQIRALQAQSLQAAAPVATASAGAAELSRFDAQLAQPQIITAAVRQLIETQGGARLRELTLRPAQPLLSTASDVQPIPAPAQPEAMPAAGQPTDGVPDAQATDAPPVRDKATPAWYAHGISLQLEGGYAALTQAIQGLERLPWLIEWRSVRLDAAEHPHIRMQVELAAISKLPTWTNR